MVRLGQGWARGAAPAMGGHEKGAGDWKTLCAQQGFLQEQGGRLCMKAICFIFWDVPFLTQRSQPPCRSGHHQNGEVSG